MYYLGFLLTVIPSKAMYIKPVDVYNLLLL